MYYSSYIAYSAASVHPYLQNPMSEDSSAPAFALPTTQSDSHNTPLSLLPFSILGSIPDTWISHTKPLRAAIH